MTLEERLAATSGKGPGFDLIRLIAAATVLLHHCRLTQHEIEDPLYQFSSGMVHFGLLAVMAFFAISGFLVTPGISRSGNTVEYCVNRGLRIFPALVAVVLLTMFALGPTITKLPLREYFLDPGVYVYAKNILTLTQDFLPGVTTSQGTPVLVNGALWTLHYEVLCYAVLAAVSILGGLRNRNILLAIFGVSYIAYVVTGHTPVVKTWIPARLLTFNSLFVYFIAGSTMFALRKFIPYSKRILVAIIGLTLVSWPFGLGSIVLPMALPYILIVLGLSELPGRMLVKIDISYGVYLIHAPVIVVLLTSLQGFHWVVMSLVVFAFTAALAYACRVWVEEPALSWKRPMANYIRRSAVIQRFLGRRTS